MPSSIKINDQTRRVDVDDDTALLWVLRDVLDLIGTKLGCGEPAGSVCRLYGGGAKR